MIGPAHSACRNCLLAALVGQVPSDAKCTRAFGVDVQQLEVVHRIFRKCHLLAVLDRSLFSSGLIRAELKLPVRAELQMKRVLAGKWWYQKSSDAVSGRRVSPLSRVGQLCDSGVPRPFLVFDCFRQAGNVSGRNTNPGFS